jgi:predicted nucleotidyltransferase
MYHGGLEMLERLFSSRIRLKLLDAFLGRPKARFYVRELARNLGEEAKNISRELNNLEKLGLLSSGREGNLKYYWASEEFFLYPELKSIVFKTTGVQGAMAESLEPSKEILSAFIFGSYAENRETTASDIDLFVVGIISDKNLHALIGEVEQVLAREIEYVLFTPSELSKRVKDHDHFVTEVLSQPKIFVKGDESALREIIK